MKKNEYIINIFGLMFCSLVFVIISYVIIKSPLLIIHSTGDSQKIIYFNEIIKNHLLIPLIINVLCFFYFIVDLVVKIK